MKKKADTTVDFAFTALKNEPISLAARAGTRNVFAEGEIPQLAMNKATTAESVHNQLSKVGGTRFVCGDIDIELDDGLFIPVSSLISYAERSSRSLMRMMWLQRALLRNM